MNFSIIFNFLTTIVVAISGLFFVVPSSPATFNESVLLYFPMISDSSNTTYTMDWSTGSNNATIVNATYYKYSILYYNNSYGYYNFNPNTYALVPKTATIQALTTNFSISYWVRPLGNDGTNSPRVIDFGTGSLVTTILTSSVSTASCPANTINTGKSGSGSYSCSNTSLVNNTWNHVVVIVTSSNTTEIYLNGVNVTRKSDISYTTLGLTTSSMPIGFNTRNTTLSYGTFDLSNFMLFNKKLNTTEIIEIYSSQQSIFNTTVVIANTTQRMDNFFMYNTNYVLWLPFRSDSSNSTYTKDYSPNSYDADNYNNVVYNSTDESYYFDALAVRYLNNSFSQGGVYTISAWIKTNNKKTTQGVAGYTTPTGYRREIYIVSGNKVRAFVNGSYWDATGVYNILSDNNWHHIACSSDDVINSAPICYIDGSAIAMSKIADYPSTFTPNIYRVGTILLNASALNPTFSFNGSIDNVMIFDNILSPTLISRLYYYGRTNNYLTESRSIPSMRTSDGLRWKYIYSDSFWLLNDSRKVLDLPMVSATSNDTYTKDYALENNGVVNGATYNSTIDGYVFNGINNSIRTQDTVDINTTNIITASIWFKTGENSSKMLLEHTTDFNSYNAYAILFSTAVNGSIFCGQHTTAYNIIRTNNSYTDDNWYHVVCIFDRTKTGSRQTIMYINGVLAPTQVHSTFSNTLSGNFSNGREYIGSRAESSLYFNGSISKPLIFNSTLTSTEIAALYRAGRN